MIELPDSFANYPLSIAERRASKSQSGGEWTPRDALISMLRRIDSGEIKDPDALIICCRIQEDGGTRTFFSNSAPDFHTSLGMLEHVKYRLLQGG